MLLACDPSLLFCSDGEVKRCKEMVDDYERLLKELPDGVSETEMSRKLWEAQVSCDVCIVWEWRMHDGCVYLHLTLPQLHSQSKRVASAALHPDSGDSIPHPFRMSGCELIAFCV